MKKNLEFRILNTESAAKMFLCAFVLILYSIFQIPTSAHASLASTWFNDSWQYRKSIPITNSVADQTRVYIQATISTLDTTRFNADCSDLRFTDASGKVLPYYIVSGCRTASTVVNTYLQNLIAGGSTIYYYYGNPSAAKAASLTNFTSAASSYSIGTIGAEVQGTSPIAYWSFDEGQGTTANDETANKNTGTLTNMSATASSTSGWQTEDGCVSGKCLAFDGTNDYVTIGFKPNLSEGTVSLWVKRNGTGTGGTPSGNVWILYNYLSSGGNNRFYLKDNNGVLETHFGLDAGGYSVGALGSNWKNITVTYTATQYQVYINGALVTTQSKTAWVNLDTTTIIGEGASAYFNGLIDEPRIYSYARTAAQIKLDYNAGLAGMSGRAAAKGSSVSVGQRSAKWLTNGLVGYWKMDEAVGTWNGTTGEVKDWSGNGNNGTAAGTVGGTASTTAGKFGNGGSFDGVDDYVSIPDSATDNPSVFTVSVWVYPKDISTLWQGIVNKKTSNATAVDGFQLALSSNVFKVGVNHGGLASSPISSNNWYHVVYVFNGTSDILYVNGVLQGSIADTWTTSSQPIRIGSYGVFQATYGNYFNGIIDDARIYSRALSDREVRDLYNYAPGPVGWWKMDEGKGQTAYDSSGNSNNGTLGSSASADSADPVWATGKEGKGLKFDGVSQYAAITDNDILDLHTNSKTWELWFKTTQTIRGILLRKSDGSNSNGCLLDIGINIIGSASPGTLRFYCGGSGELTVTTAGTYNNGVWHHVAVALDRFANTVTLYIDGRKDGSASAAGLGITDWNAAAALTLSSTANFYNGSIDDFRIYNYARTPEQIMEDMNARGNSNEGGSGSAAVSAAGKTTVGYWKFDEGQGTTAKDSSPQKHNAVFNSTYTPTWTNNGKFGKALNFVNANGQFGQFVEIYGISQGLADLKANNTLSFSFWINASSTQINNARVFGNGDNGNSNQYNMVVDSTKSNGKYRFVLSFHNGSDYQSFYSSYFLLPGSWNQVVFACQYQTSCNIYLNGNLLQNVPTVYSGDATLVNYFSIGGRDGGYSGFNGMIDEFKIYNYALTADDVRTEYNAGSALKLGSFSTSANGIASSSAASLYCVPGSTDPCSPPVAEWKFEEGKNSVTAADTSGNANTGTIYPGTAGTNTATSSMWVAGKTGKGLKFDGVDDYVVVNSPIGSATSYSGSVWMKTSKNYATDYGLLSSWYDTVNSKYFALDIIKNDGTGVQTGSNNGGVSGVANSVRVICNGGVINVDRLDGTVVVNDGKWHYITGVCNVGTNTISLYIDGVLNNSRSDTMSGTLVPNNATIGRHPTSATQFFNGLIDDVRVYNYARTAAQVAWDYNRGKPVGWWKFDGGQGGVAHDSSGNNNNGTIYPGTAGTQTATSTMWTAGASGKRNGSLNFDGTDDYVDAGNGSSVNLTGSFTVSTWAKNANTGNQVSTMVSKEAITSPYRGWQIGFAADSEGVSAGKKFVAFLRQTTVTSQRGYASNSNVVDGNWHLWTAVFNQSGDNIIMYKDGVLLPSTADWNSGVAWPDPTISTDVSIGANLTSTRFSGQIDDVQIFNYALTAVQVKTLYNDGAVRFAGPTPTPGVIVNPN